MDGQATRRVSRPRPNQAGSLTGMTGGGGSVTSSGLIFFSDFDDETDDAQWGTLPTDWNDDYATSPAPLLASTHSLYGAGLWSGREHISDTFSDASASVIYARVALRRIAGANSGYGMALRLLNSGSLVAAVALYYDSTILFYRIYAYDNDGSTYTSPVSYADLSDATYWLYLTYTKGTSVVGQLKDASHTLVTGWTVTWSTSIGSGDCNQVGIRLNLSGLNMIFDNVEVRKDTSWGS